MRSAENDTFSRKMTIFNKNTKPHKTYKPYSKAGRCQKKEQDP